jgi:hypothetical protein
LELVDILAQSCGDFTLGLLAIAGLGKSLLERGNTLVLLCLLQSGPVSVGRGDDT